MEAQKEVQSLTLKVMRLSKPGFHVSAPHTCSPGSIVNGPLFTDPKGTAMCGMDPFLQLPNSFGIIYLGETFRIYISLNNPTAFDVFNTTLKVELQTTTQWIKLFENTDSIYEKFAPGESHDQVVSHDVKESGINILSCTVNYVKHDGEKKYFRKFFKFQVMNPININPRIVSLNNSVFLEASLENATQSSLFIESVRLESTDSYTMTDLNPSFNAEDEELMYMKPASSRQFLFQLVSKLKDTNSKNALTIGRLEVVWRSMFGEIGRFYTTPLTKKASSEEVEIVVAQVPDQIVLEQPFFISLQVLNKSAKLISPRLVILKNFMDGIVVNDFLVQDLGPITPGNSKIQQLNLFPTKPGIQQISGISIVINDPSGTREFEFNNLADVYVDNPQIN